MISLTNIHTLKHPSTESLDHIYDILCVIAIETGYRLIPILPFFQLSLMRYRARKFCNFKLPPQPVFQEQFKGRGKNISPSKGSNPDWWIGKRSLLPLSQSELWRERCEESKDLCVEKTKRQLAYSDFFLGSTLSVHFLVLFLMW